jgi:two-component system sensor histidine kinase/response regulator
MSGLFEALISFDASLASSARPEAVLAAILDHLPSLLPCSPRAMAVIDEATLLPDVCACEPAKADGRMRDLLASAIERGLFALALRRGQAVIDELPDGDVLLLQACATGTHLAGLLIGVCPAESAEPERLAVVALAAARAGAAHENLILRDRILAHTQGLEQAVEERTRDLAAARDRAEVSSRSKSAFLATVSHELRTPLNGIIGMTDLLHDDEPQPARRDRLAVVRSCADDLLLQIDGILDLSRIEAGRLDLTACEVDPGTVVMQVLRTLAPKAQAQGLELAWIPDALFPARVLIDAGRLRQVLLNLAGNAVKFTASGSVALRGRAHIACGIWQLTFDVVDTGPGIAPEAQARLFTPFEQGDASINRRFGGSGLGLTISRRLCELMGGTITLSSTLGTGSTFTATVQAAAHPPPARTSALSGLRVRGLGAGLLGETVTAALRRASVQVVEGEAALAVIDAEDAQAAAQLRRLPRDLPVVLLALLTGPSALVVAAVDGRPHRVLSKPVDPDELAVAIHDLTVGRSQPTSPSNARVPAADFAGARVLYADDQAVNRLVLAAQLKRLGVEVVLASGGAEAVAQALAHTWDLILIDCQMPEVDGFMAAAQIRAGGCTTPLIAVTAHAMAGDREDCLQRGFTGYLAKPVRPPQLVATLTSWIGHPVMAAAADPTPPDRFNSLRAEVGEEVFREVLQAMLDEGPRLAREATEAAAAGDLALAGRRAHALKGDAANLGLDGLANLARELEQAARGGDLGAAQTAGSSIPEEWRLAEAALRQALA